MSIISSLTTTQVAGLTTTVIAGLSTADIQAFKADADLGAYYNTQLAGGKWSHMMDQTHIGYNNWQQPAQNTPHQVAFQSFPDPAGKGLVTQLEAMFQEEARPEFEGKCSQFQYDPHHPRREQQP